jgi:phosphatidylglycerophosphatase A
VSEKRSTPVTTREVLGDPVHWLPFGAGAGLLPWAPGTWGSLLAVLLAWWLPPVPPAAALAGLAGLFLAGVILCGASARRLGVHDHGGIVLDEIVAMLAVLVFTPRTVVWYAAAFLLFRAFDILKPWPIREVDHRLAGGLGIMLDDGLAAVYAVLTLMGIQLLPLPF